MKRRASVWLLCVFGLAGCVTVAELRESPPVRVATVGGAYLPLATCVLQLLGKTQAEEGTLYQLVDVTGAKTASLVAVTRFPGGLFYMVPEPLLELRFDQGDGDTMKIEARRSFPGAALELRAWPIVEQCAGKTVAVSPPLN